MTKLAPNDHLLELATQLEEVALRDDYFISRKLYPNVDFYTGLIYRAMGFPTEMFTVLFAIGRLPGWLAHYKEMLHDPATKIARPRQVLTSAVERDFVDMEKQLVSPSAGAAARPLTRNPATVRTSDLDLRFSGRRRGSRV